MKTTKLKTTDRFQIAKQIVKESAGDTLTKEEAKKLLRALNNLNDE